MGTVGAAIATRFRKLGTLAVLAALGACSARPPSDVFACRESLDCPENQRCYSGVCSDPMSLGTQRSGDESASPSDATTPSALAALGGEGARESGGAGRSDAAGATAGTSAGSITGRAGASGDVEDHSGRASFADSDAGAGRPSTPKAGGAGNAGGAGTVSGAGAGADSAGRAATHGGMTGGSAGAKSECTCTLSDLCCDGCSPRNEAGSCQTDNLACTQDICRAGQCAHEQEPTACLLNGACYGEGQAHPDAQCKYCHVTSGSASWTSRAAGTACDDGVYCNGADSCSQLGACSAHTGDPCGNNACQRCDEPSRSCGASTDTTWYDASTGLLWQRTISSSQADWQSASDKCAALVLCGQQDWRLPTVDELRALVHGCEATAPGGSCRVTSSCASSACWDMSCNSCAMRTSGTYLPSGLDANTGLTWTSSATSDDAKKAWTVYFPQGAIQAKDKTEWGDGRCLRKAR